MPNEVRITKTCPWCKKDSLITIDYDKWQRWQDGELIQNVFPEMSRSKREILISGTHPKCWDEMWGENDGA